LTHESLEHISVTRTTYPGETRLATYLLLSFSQLEGHQGTAITHHFIVLSNAETTGIARHHPGVQAIPHTVVSTNTMKAGGGGGTFSFPSPTGNSNKEVLGSVYMTHPTPVTSGQKTRESEAELNIKLFIQMFIKVGDRVSSKQLGHVR
jgi:hypothetical protein